MSSREYTDMSAWAEACYRLVTLKDNRKLVKVIFREIESKLWERKFEECDLYVNALDFTKLNLQTCVALLSIMNTVEAHQNLSCLPMLREKTKEMIRLAREDLSVFEALISGRTTT